MVYSGRFGSRSSVWVDSSACTRRGVNGTFHCWGLKLAQSLQLHTNRSTTTAQPNQRCHSRERWRRCRARQDLATEMGSQLAGRGPGLALPSAGPLLDACCTPHSIHATRKQPRTYTHTATGIDGHCRHTQAVKTTWHFKITRSWPRPHLSHTATRPARRQPLLGAEFLPVTRQTVPACVSYDTGLSMP